MPDVSNERNVPQLLPVVQMLMLEFPVEETKISISEATPEKQFSDAMGPTARKHRERRTQYHSDQETATHSFVVDHEGMSSDELLRSVLEEVLVQRPW